MPENRHFPHLSLPLLYTGKPILHGYGSSNKKTEYSIIVRIESIMVCICTVVHLNYRDFGKNVVQFVYKIIYLIYVQVFHFYWRLIHQQTLDG